MTEIKEFDLLNSPLEGTNLVEASAGTGKTYTISGLFLRLVLEKNLPVSEILVVTFTEAATEELKHRLRTRLREAISAFSVVQSEDEFINRLLDKVKKSKTVLRRLNEALHALDQAAISTIHGFCRRMLFENAFESGSLFDTELVTDQEALKREVVDDFWRKHFYEASPLFVNYALNHHLSPDSLLSLVANRFSLPYLKIIPEVEGSDFSKEEREFTACFEEVRNAWLSARTDVEEIFYTCKGLNRGRYRNANIPIWIRGMDQFVESLGHDPSLFKGFEKFTLSELEACTKRDCAPPFHPFFESCERLRKAQESLERAFEQYLLALKRKLFHYAANELTRRKHKRNIQYFDDLLLSVHKALEEKGGEYLVGAITAKFKAALIDEFQDTDPIQYAIFKKIFGKGNRTLFLIGDPKQAIYGFRGADIFAYMKAKGDVKSQYTLKANWRSDPDLITAINAIYSETACPFVYEEIPFHPAKPAAHRNPEPFTLDRQPESPFQLWFVDARDLTEDAKPISKAQARKTISKAVSMEIARLLDLGRRNRVLIGDRPMREGDVAVLVRTNAEALILQQALSVFRIPSVLHSSGNLFDTHEALEVERLLGGIAEPNNETLIRRALTTDIMGIMGEEIEVLMEDQTGWENWLTKFKSYHDFWNERGFIQMFRLLLTQEEVLPRLMSFTDGERRNTNLLHLSEVLHQVSVEKKLGLSELLKWLSEQRLPGAQRLEEHQLRLESDENVVKVVTIHKSKGLEYPVVFCPFAWDGSRIGRSKEPIVFHDEAHDRMLTLDLGSSLMAQNRKLAEKELLAENLRLLYVALTRAKSRCYLAWGRFNKAETSAPAYLLHHSESCEYGDIVDATGETFRGLNDEDVRRALGTAVDRSQGSMKLSDISTEPVSAYSPVPGQAELLSCRAFSGSIDRQWGISSFSSMVSIRRHAEELPDRDAISLPDELEQMQLQESDEEEERFDIFSFPKGARAGTFLHDLLEHLDFTEEDSTTREALVADKLRAHGFEFHWLDTICSMIDKVLWVPLDPEREELRLSRIQNKDRLNELEFYFPLKTLSPERLRCIFREHSGEPMQDFPEIIGQLQFAPTKGFMRGFIDLVFQWGTRFYLVDWKSNFLGSQISDYSQESLAREMGKEFYFLQYYIYTLALDQYLRLRMPDYRYQKNFGGIYYIFLRGVDPVTGLDFGIHRDLPSPELIASLKKELMDVR